MLSPARQAADALFDIIDKDGEGSISHEALMVHLLGQGMQVEDVTHVFQALDTDHDNKVSRSEWRAGYSLLPQMIGKPTESHRAR